MYHGDNIILTEGTKERKYIKKLYHHKIIQPDLDNRTCSLLKII